MSFISTWFNYNIPSNNRELQLELHLECSLTDYNIPSNNRELQRMLGKAQAFLIITYQVITGNYSSINDINVAQLIITYQVITGNYSAICLGKYALNIITYQVITGNYSLNASMSV